MSRTPVRWPLSRLRGYRRSRRDGAAPPRRRRDRSRSASRSRSRATSPTPASPPSRATSCGQKTVNAKGGILGRQVQLDHPGRREQPDPGGDELPEPHHEGPRRPRVRAVLDAAHRAVRGGREPLRLRVHRAGRRRSGRVRPEAAQRLLHAARADRQERRRVREVDPARCRSRSGRRPRRTRRSTIRSRRRSPTACGRSSRRPGSRRSTRRSTRPRPRHDADRREDRGREARHDRRRHAGRRRLLARSRRSCRRSTARSSCSWRTARTAPVSSRARSGRTTRTGSSARATGTPLRQTYGNPVFIKSFLKMYGGKAGDIDPGSAEAYAVGQVAQRVISKVGLNNAKIIAALHTGKWPTVEGDAALGLDRPADRAVPARRVDPRPALPRAAEERRREVAGLSEAGLGTVGRGG